MSTHPRHHIGHRRRKIRIHSRRARRDNGQRKKAGYSSTHIIDTIVTNKLFGFPIFLAIMTFIFWATFYIGSFPMEWIESLVSWLGDLSREYLPDGWIKRPPGRRHHRRRRRRHRIPAQHPHPLCMHLVHGRLRLHGPSRLHHGQTHAPTGSARQVIHTARNGIWLHRTLHNGHTLHRKPFEPTHHHTHQPLCELLGPTPPSTCCSSAHSSPRMPRLYF